MPQVRELIEYLQTHHKPDEILAWSLWNLEDVHHVATESDKTLSDTQATEILEIIHVSQDAEGGLNWGFIEFTMNNYLNHTL